MQAQNNFINHIFMLIIVIDHQSIHNGMRWSFVYQFPIVNYDIFFLINKFWFVLRDDLSHFQPQLRDGPTIMIQLTDIHVARWLDGGLRWTGCVAGVSLAM